MAAVLTGTPVEVIWASGINPAGQSITIPADATAVYMFWAFDGVDANGHGLATATLAGNSPSQTFEVTTGTGFLPATGVAAWYNPSTGSQTLDVSWDIAPVEGPVTTVVFVKDGDTSTWRDVDGARAAGTTAVSVTLTTVSGDLVIKFDQHYDGVLPLDAPSLSAGWTNGLTGGNVSEASRLSYISATGTTQVCNSEDEDYASIVAISIPAAPTGTSVAITGNSSTSAVGAAAPANSKTPTGVDAFPALGTPRADRSVAMSGVGATGEAGTVIASSGNTIELDGVAGIGEAGTVSASAGSSVALTGVQASTSAGAAAPTVAAAATGQEATGGAGTVAGSVRLPDTGARRRRLGPHPSIPVWQLGKFNRPRRNTQTTPTVTAALSGVMSSITAGAVAAAAQKALSGAGAASAAGSVEKEVRVREGSRRRAGGVNPAFIGPYSFARYYKSRRNIEPQPTEAQALFGAASSFAQGTVVPAMAVALTGTSGAAAVGSVGATQAGSASLTPVFGTGGDGDVTAALGITLQGVLASTSVGAVAAVTGVVVELSGVSASVDTTALASSAGLAVTGTTAYGTIGIVSGSTPGTWVPVNTTTSTESWTPFSG